MTKMADPRISHIELDEATILWRNADIEQERRIAIFDLIEENSFKPLRAFAAGHRRPLPAAAGGPGRPAGAGDFRRRRRPSSRRWCSALAASAARSATISRSAIRYYQAIRKATAQEIETIDMARRGVHNEAAELLLERLDGKVETDFATARRLFTLICVLHIRG